MSMPETLLDRPANEAIACLLESQLEIARAKLASLKLGGDAEALHDFRVALRRLRSIAGVFPEYGRQLVGRKRLKALKRLARGTNEARDAEVRLHWIEDNESIIPQEPEFHTGYDSLHEAFSVEYQSLVDDLRKPLRRRFKRIRERVLQRIRKERRASAPIFSAVLAERTVALGNEFRTQLALLCDNRDRAAVHRGRILAKQLRYLLEPVTAELPEAVAVVHKLKELQTELGDLHDRLLRADEMMATGEKTGSLIFHGLLVEILQRGKPLQALETEFIRPSLKGVLCLADHLRQQLSQSYTLLESRLGADYVNQLGADLEAIPKALLPPAIVPPPASVEAVSSDAEALPA